MDTVLFKTPSEIHPDDLNSKPNRKTGALPMPKIESPDLHSSSSASPSVGSSGDLKAFSEQELAEAANYVTSLLPRDTPADARGCVSISSRFISSQELGGDCFDHYWLNSEKLVMYLLDVSGHGLGAAL